MCYQSTTLGHVGKHSEKSDTIEFRGAVDLVEDSEAACLLEEVVQLREAL